MSERQRINLSDAAYRTIKSDCLTFAYNDQISYSEIIANIILSWADKSHAISPDSEEAKKLVKAPSRFPKREIPYLRKTVQDYLERQDIKEIIKHKTYQGHIGKFLKTILEEYAEKPYVERERIYFCEVMDSIGAAIECRQIIQMEIAGRTIFVKPYKVMTDKQSFFNYLVGLSGNDAKTINKITTNRISRLSKLRRVDDKRFIFSDIEKDLIEEAINTRGVQFLRNETEHIRVRLTNGGKRFFQNFVFQRPDLISVDGDIYVFNCTQEQAEYYFFKFGAEAEIIEPISLKKKFAEKYQNAALLYWN